MAIAPVQRKGKGGLAVASLAIGSGDGWAAPTAGNLLLVTANSDATVATPSGYLLGPNVVDGNGAYCFYKYADGTETTVTVTPGVSANTSMTVAEYSGVALGGPDTSNSSTIAGSSGTTTTSVSVTTTAAGDLIVAVAATHSGTGGVAPTSPSWTNSFVQAVTGDTGNASPTCTTFVAELIAGAPGSYSTSASWTTACSDRQELVIAFKAAATSAGGPGTQMIPPPLLYYLAARDQAQWAGGSGSAPKTYYVATAGNDSHDGLTPGSAWQTISKVNSTTLNPGDTVLFNGGDTFSGQIAPTTSGTAAAPIVYSSYGTGNATITNTTADAFAFVSHGGFEVRNLTIVGGTTSFSNGSAGVDCYSPSTGRYDYILVDSCDISGFEFGVIVGGDTNVDGFTNVTVNNVNAHDNKDTGIAFWGGTYDGTHFSNSNITVTNCTTSGNLGDSVKTTPNGIGIVLGMCSTGLVDQCVAHGNGGSNGTGNGPIGIWAYDSTAVTIQRSLSYSNRTSSTTDGGGFDLDNNVTNSTIQYCFAYDNDGAGILGFNAGTAWSGNTVRYNLTWGNGRNNSTAYGEMVFGGPIATSNVYGNTCVARDNGVTPVAALMLNATPTGLTFRNNILIAQTGNNALASSAWATSAALMQGNVYYRSAGASIKWGATTYTSLATWRAAVTGQEQVSGVNVGFTSDPLLNSPGTTPTVTTVAGTATYTDLQLQSSSPVTTAGLDLNGTFGINPGTRDFWGAALTVPLSVGANELDTVSLSRTASDTAAASDSATASVVLARTAADNALASDAAARALILARTAPSAAQAADTASRQMVEARTTADTAAAGDTAARALANGRTTGDTAQATDSAARVLATTRTVNDTAQATDVPGRAAVFARTTGDTASATDAAAESTAHNLSRTTSDTAQAVDSAARALAEARTAADTASATDVPARQVADSRTAADTAQATDAAVRALATPRTATNTAQAADAASRALAEARTVSDTAGATDSAVESTHGGVSRTASDTANATDTAGRALTLPRTAADSAQATDTAARAGTRTRSAADTASATDAAAMSFMRGRACADTAAAADSAAVTNRRFVRAIVDAAAAADTALAVLALAQAPAWLNSSDDGPAYGSGMADGSTAVGGVDSGATASGMAG